MKKWWWASVLVVAILAFNTAPSHAWGGHHFHGGTRVFVGVGGPFWWGPYPYWYYPPPPAYVYAPPAVVVQQPPVYVEQNPPPPSAGAPAAPQQFWYYCQPSGAYYPSVQTCQEAWVKVPSRGPQ
jgi:hypothetical protein